jgi:alpha-tubulin suppressor-like RCC1 family protein
MDQLRTTTCMAGIVALCLTSCGGGGGEAGDRARSEVASVTVSPSDISLLVGETAQLEAIVRDDTGNRLTGRVIAWNSSEPAIATVSAAGEVAAVGAGAVTISATAEGETGSASVAVNESISAQFTHVATGIAHSCAITADGAAYCWGRGESGQLGIAPPATSCDIDGISFPCSQVPIKVDSDLTLTQITAGGAHSCALAGDGTALCWGSNLYGQPGDDSTGDRTSPVPVQTVVKFESIDAGAEHTCALTQDGAEYCWGLNARGQLGDNSTLMRSVPVAVAGGHTFQSIVAGGFGIG